MNTDKIDEARIEYSTTEHGSATEKLTGEGLEYATTERDAAATVRKNIEAVDAGLDVQLKSELDTLGILETLWKFRKTVLICSIAGFSSITDGMCSDEPRSCFQDTRARCRGALSQTKASSRCLRPMETQRTPRMEQNWIRHGSQHMEVC